VLGWPKKTISFDRIVQLATASNGWASVGKPEFGRFKYVHTNPDSSTSGAEAVTGSSFAVANKREGLTTADVAKAAPRVKDLERSIVHYGDSTLFIEDQLCKGGLAYASAAAMEETTVIDFNRRHCQSTKLVSLYPSEGSFVSDSPYMVLDAPWVSPAKRTAAAAFQKYLA
jgi:Ca-activated chloride channel family protein